MTTARSFSSVWLAFALLATAGLAACGGATEPDVDGGCLHNADCPHGEFCMTPDGACDGPGGCTPFPQACPFVCTGVCGCDGHGYCNECLTNTLGINVAHAGHCGL